MRRKPPRKSFFSYLLPFFLLALLIYAGVVFLQKSGNFGANSPASLQVIEPEVKVLLKNNEKWRTVPENVQVKLFSGDTIKTASKSEAKLFLFKESFLSLDKSTSISIHEHIESDSFQKTHIEYFHGKILASISRILNPKSDFIIQFSNIRVHSKGGVFIFKDDIIQVLEGKVKIERLEGDIVVAEKEIGVGQQLTFFEENVGDFAEVTAINPEIYVSPWIEKALGNNIITPTSDEFSSVVDTPEKDLEETEEENNASESSATEKLTISFPKNKQEIFISPLEIKGKVAAEAISIAVNDYELSKFKKGDTEWMYRAKTEWNNLKYGKNTFEITAKFEDGSLVTKNLEINFNPNRKETETDKKEETDNVSNDDDNTTKFVKITSHQDQQTIKAKSIELKGTVSKNAVAVTVNDYQLSKFKKGDTEWMYRASYDFGNLEEGENTFKVVVKFSDDSVLTKSISLQAQAKQDNKEDNLENNENDSEKKDDDDTEKTSSNKQNTTTDNGLKLAVLSPEEGANIESDPVIIRGTVPKGTAKVSIGEYFLRTFNEGDTQFKYSASKKYHNLEYGEKNKYLITAYDQNDNEIASIQFSFFSVADE